MDIKKVIKKLFFCDKNTKKIGYNNFRNGGIAVGQYIIEGRGLTKAYKKRIVIDDLNMHVKRGEIYGFVGPNGAGKSTTLKMLLNLTKPDSGEFYVDNLSVSENSYAILKRVGSIIENPYFYNQLTGRENLELHCEYMGYPNKEEIEKVLKLVALNDVEEKLISQYSLGMKQRLAIARAIITRPEILILDEPINGLDPEGIIEVRSLLRGLNRDLGMTIIISSHILAEMEMLVDTVGIMKAGKLLREISIEEIHEKNVEYIECIVDYPQKVGYVLEELLNIRKYRIVSDKIVQIYEKDKNGKEISKAFIENGIGIESIQKKQNSLEEYFFKVTKGEKID